ncbi:MAG: VTT domain-containing protein [Candidatus Omnitrophica bacterium]|nr:VTT domain-containing protein [Candidatus Omnitrophota bacterium]
MKQTNKSLNRFLVFLAFLAFVAIVGITFRIDETKVNALFERFPLGYAAMIFVLLYTLGTFAFWTLKEPLKVVGAIFFGAYLSTGLIYLAELINGVVFFKLSRRLGKDFVAKKVGGGFKRFYERLESLPLLKAIFVRANPLIPYRVFDVGLGLSRISFKKFLLAILIASPARIFWLQFPLAAMRGFSIEKMLTYFEQNMAVALTMVVYIVVVCLTPFLIKQKPVKED